MQKAPIRDIISGSDSMYADEGIGLSGVRRRGRGNLIGICGFFRREGREKTELAHELTQGAWGKCIASEISRVCLHQEKASGYRFQAAGLTC